MIQVIVADDELPARQRLISFLNDYPDFELLSEAETGEETIRKTNELKPDILFLDIQMPKGDGFEVISELQHDPLIVFTTAYDEYAINAFNVHVLDYLLKPFSKERFAQSIALINRLLRDPVEYKDRTRAAAEEAVSSREYLQRVSVKDKYVFSIIPVEKITSIKTSGGLVFIQVGEREYQSDTTLNQFEQRLDPGNFMRIHRTAIVNLEQISRIMPWGQGRLSVVMDNNETFQISRDRMKDFKERVGLRL